MDRLSLPTAGAPASRPAVPVPPSSLPALVPTLRHLRRRLRFRDGLGMAQNALWPAAFASVLIQLLGRTWPLPTWRCGRWPRWPSGFSPSLVRALLHPLSLAQVARRCDIELGLKERLGTAMALSASQPPSALLAGFRPSLLALQHQDALIAAQAIDPRRDLPLDWRRRPLFLAAVLFLAASTLAWLPNPMAALVAERAAVAQAAEEQAAQIKALRHELEQAQGLAPADREELLRRLEELAAQLRANPGDREEALADLSAAEEALRDRLDPKADARRAALEALASRLQALTPAERAEEAGLPQAAEALGRLAEELAGMDAGDQQSLAGTLAQMAARAAQTGDAELAQALAEMAQAALAGDAAAAEQAAQRAGQALARAQSDLAGQAATRRALSGIQGSRQAVAQAGRQPGRATASGQGQSQGQSQGQGQGQGQGQPGGGGGTTANSLPPATRSGSMGRPGTAGRPWTTTGFEQQVYAPRQSRLNTGEELRIPGQDSSQGDTEVREAPNLLPGSSGPSLVPYHEVYYDYLDAANEAIEQSAVPVGLKDYVRDYFSRLEP